MGHFVIDCTNEHVAPGATKADAASIAFSAEDGDADCRREWIVDSGATSHMTGRLGNLINVQELVEPRELTVASGDNLVATTSDTGPFVRNGEDCHKVEAPGAIQSMNMVNATSNTLPGVALMVREVSHVKTWHRHFGYLNQQSLNHLNLPWHGVMEQSWQTSVSDKLAQHLFSPKDKRVLKKHQLLLAIDYVGPMHVTARDGDTGSINIVVEPIHLEMMYPLREKSFSAQLEAIKVCIARLTAYAPSYRVVFLKSDDAQEYVGSDITEFDTKKVIVEEFSTLYRPQQNDRVERGNRVIVDIARTMMQGVNIPKTNWAYTFVCAAYVRNWCPIKVLDGKTLMEALLGLAPDISNPRVFGCNVQALVPKKRRKKLESKNNAQWHIRRLRYRRCIFSAHSWSRTWRSGDGTHSRVLRDAIYSST
ncbi:hypothetical protein PF002_g3815 [Phytophthora fragariae]|uniref:Integrase catalytic domain-containing protein n=1 Tax=Phytophthora fragariae TaxID=53985 RepID=A0A6A4A972_9STRA|nr:hypothetical protein PF002_g3815 [Phytophthora fragariae]